MSVGRNATYNLIGSIVPVALSFATVPAYLHLIGPERYGVLAIAWLLLGYFGLFDLGLGRATSFRIAALRDAPPEARADTFWAALAVNVVMGLVGGAVLWAAAAYFFSHVFKVDEHMRPEIMAAVPLLAASVPVATLTGVLTGALQGREKFLETNSVSTVSTVLFQLLPLGLVLAFGPNVTMLLTGALAARLLAAVVLAYRCHRELTAGHPRRLVRREIVTLLKFGGWVNLVSIFGPMLQIVDRFAIGAILGAVAVTIYTVPFQLAQRMAILPASITNALFPRMSAATREEQETLSERSSGVMIGLMSLPILAAVFLVEPFLRLWIGTKVGIQSAPVGRIVLIGFWFNAFALIPFVRLQASGRPDIVSKFVMAEVPPYLILLYFALKFFGFEGCALAFTVRCVSDYLWLNWLASRRLPNAWLQAAAFAVLILAVWLAAQWPSLMDWRWWASAAGTGLILTAISWRALPPDVAQRIVSAGPVRALRLLRGGGVI